MLTVSRELRPVSTLHGSGMKARLFEQLPEETQGGQANTKSLLNDESVQAACRAWLSAQQVGSITPRLFCAAVNEEILHTLGITLKHPISERTAHQWLLHLGYQQTLIKKGVYMDGHKRPDMVKYHNNIFLPAMKLFEEWMMKHMEPDLKPVEPILLPGVRKVIAYFHDECCFHALDYKRTAWLAKGQTVLQKKSRGWLIHVSDFITEGTGWLVQQDQNRNIIWDTEQLMKQMDCAIEIHNAIHPDTTALCIFDQSSAHTSLPPDALHAWERNMSDGGKQKLRKDTIIPASNPYPEHHSKVQRMMTTTGQVKGMKTVLMDHKCIFLPKFHCELNPIEMILKKTFKESKELAKKYLDACPVETIWQFINRSWRFMSAYQRGLTGGAAEWAVTQQKQHCAVSNRAMMLIELIVN
ncbi:hypothetical protein ARMGADRAFT_1048655 [Armillaria gallica]|uniref:Uncharacterized protein n=1 Tax=Armillaria gallica TaxID=47427 RepID=A0A2H3CV32_ARMGA|nr:hypothetical protein ARMGADRAFT_1048655 [Armillaria gallica]